MLTRRAGCGTSHLFDYAGRRRAAAYTGRMLQIMHVTMWDADRSLNMTLYANVCRCPASLVLSSPERQRLTEDHRRHLPLNERAMAAIWHLLQTPGMHQDICPLNTKGPKAAIMHGGFRARCIKTQKNKDSDLFTLESAHPKCPLVQTQL